MKQSVNEKVEKNWLSTEESSPLFLQTACFTGHRKNLGKEEVQDTEEVIDFAIAIGYKTFLCGMAMGFDSLAFECVYKRKKMDKEIRLIACVPCKGQEKYFPKKEQKAYQSRLNQADQVLILSEKYFSGCMHVRNRFMVDHSSCVIAFLRENTGGTAYTVNYAKEKKKLLINV